MPARQLLRVTEKGTYSHIYNVGVEKRVIFNDQEDYQTFLGFLKDYLSAPGDPSTAKKQFTVNGRIFHGVPHQPKNYFNQVELVAYNLSPNHFHLLLHQTTEGSLERFMRSLSTRYSMYFNKKYSRTGSLFQGPYKSIHIKDIASLLFTTLYIHNNTQEDGKDLKSEYSSYKEYLGLKETPWINTKTVLSFFDKVKDASLKGTKDYKNFVETYKLSKTEIEALERVALESISEHLAGRIPELVKSEFSNKNSQISTIGNTSSKETAPTRNIKTPARVPEFIAAFTVFVLLLTLGARNVRVSLAHTAQATPDPSVAGTSDTSPIETEEIKPITLASIKITDGATSVNIRKEPSTQSEKIGEANDGDTFKEFVSVNEKWYEVKLSDGSIGFISARYIEIIEDNQSNNTVENPNETIVEEVSE